uniref:inorganic diphosphatase n=1 Tax=Ascaris lumbricoides TaxID=6252 RepID=A0A0M3I3M5_ASCLU
MTGMTFEMMNLIKQDTGKGIVRFIDSAFPQQDYIRNNGISLQIWENPVHVVKEMKAKGKSDLIDITQIGSKVHRRSDLVHVKVVRALALIDEGESDWKLEVFGLNDPVATEISTT